MMMPSDSIPTFEEAKEERKKLITELRQGNRGDRRLANLLAQCRKGNRCNRLKCPICQRRKALPKWKFPSALVKSVIGTLMPREIFVDSITIAGKRRPLDEVKVRAMAASMEQIGLQTPITLRKEKKKLILVAGYLRLAAAKRLGWDAILCVTLCGNKTDARLWQIMENLYRDELTVLERAEHVEELRLLIRIKSEEGQVAPPGGRQPKEFGLKKTARALGLKREEVRRSKAIAGLSPRVKAKVRALGLDDNQRALLEIATQPTPKAQLRALKDIVKRRRAARNHNGSAVAGDKKTAAEIQSLEAGIRNKEATLDSLKRDLAAERERLEEVHDKVGSEAEADMELKSVQSPPLTTADEDITAFLDRFSLEDQLQFDDIETAWATHVQPLWDDASAVVQEYFISKLRSTSGHGQREH
ncbi:MAG TPA: ParB/RepB/Spo0J family partition protein [Xanthobacteraceae bacterium]|jgi:ParB family chromosome partitioning protein|nr:ParB/RepB/Spo0J family partition protein [Xanthobacteraceae bacterium]